MLNDTKTLDRAVPLGYAVLVVAAVIFYQAAVAPVAIFGAFAVAGYYSIVKPRLRAREWGRDQAEEDEPGATTRDG